jgi:hypothetical protein
MREAPSGSLAYALGLGMVGVWLGLMLGNCFGDRFTYYPMIGYFWAFLGLTLKAHDLVLAQTPTVESEPVSAAPVRRWAQPRSRVHE